MKAKVDFLRKIGKDGIEKIVYPKTLLRAITDENGNNVEDTLKQFVKDELSQVGLNGLDKVDNTSDIDKPVSNAQQTAIDNAKTESNSYTDDKIAQLINGAPETLDTLKEVSDALAENDTVVEALNNAIGNKANAIDLTSHVGNKNNPHGVTKEQVGLSNVPNVETNDQTPTYTVASANTALSSGEKLSVAFGKIAKAVSSLISHLSDTVGHITSAERTAWNAKANGTHTHTKSQINDFPTSMTPTAHNQAASTITAGTFAGKVNANATAAATVTTAQVRDIYAGTTDMTAGTTALTSGTIYVFYEYE